MLPFVSQQQRGGVPPSAGMGSASWPPNENLYLPAAGLRIPPLPVEALENARALQARASQELARAQELQRQRTQELNRITELQRVQEVQGAQVEASAYLDGWLGGGALNHGSNLGLYDAPAGGSRVAFDQVRGWKGAYNGVQQQGVADTSRKAGQSRGPFGVAGAIVSNQATGTQESSVFDDLTESMVKSTCNCVEVDAVPTASQLPAVSIDQAPKFASLVNYPVFLPNKRTRKRTDGFRHCVMCGTKCPYTSKSLAQACNQVIPPQNRAVCTLCDVKVFEFTPTGLLIKYCKGCKNFRSLSSYCDTSATKCTACKKRCRDKYQSKKSAEGKKVRQYNKQHVTVYPL